MRLNFHEVNRLLAGTKTQGVGARNVIDTNSASLAQTRPYRGPNQLAASLKSVLPLSIAVELQDRSGLRTPMATCGFHASVAETLAV